MKNMLRFIFLLIVLPAIGLASAQNCVPDQNITSPGFYPKEIDTAFVETNYKQVLQIRVFPDTTIYQNNDPVTVDIDSINVLDIKGLPTGFYYTCSRKNCNYIPDSTGCATLEGTASKSQAARYPLDIIIEVYGRVFGTFKTSRVDTLRDFSMLVFDPDNPVSVEEISGRVSGLIYPNPSSGEISIKNFTNFKVEQVSCYNHLGQPVTYKLSNGKLSLGDHPNGLYFVSIRLDDGRVLTEQIQINQ